MARRTQTQSVSLFPFLAVLVCTMGALILLLLVTTRRIRQEQARYDSAVETLEVLQDGEAAANQVPDVDDFVVTAKEPVETNAAAVSVPEDLNEILLPPPDTSIQQHAELVEAVQQARETQQKLQTQQKELQATIVQGEAELKVVRQKIQDADFQLLTTGKASRQLQHLEDELAQLKTEEAELELQIAQYERQLSGVEAELEQKSKQTEEAEGILAKRESALIQLRKIAEEASDQTATNSAMTKLEFTNTDGTAREPIVVNVDGKGFTLEPTGITISLDDLKGFPADDNPLLAGILSIAEHRSEDFVAKAPYVLLLVRPSGSLGFYQAQQVMTNAEIHFGYELLEADREIALGSPDEAEVKVVRQSVLEALNRRASVYGALLAANRTASRMSGAGSGTLSDGRPLAPQSANRGPRNADGRTLQEVMNLPRVYAGGEAKPQPGVPRLAGNNARRWPLTQQPQTQQPQNMPRQEQPSMQQQPVQQPSGSPWGNGYEKDRSTGSSQVAEKSTENPWANGQYEASVEASSQQAKGVTQGDGSESADQPSKQSQPVLAEHSADDFFRSLSENLGVQGQRKQGDGNPQTSTEIHPSPGSEQASANHRPDHDWPSTETAPQSKGSRPVDPAMVAERNAGSQLEILPREGTPSAEPRAKDQTAWMSPLEPQTQPSTQSSETASPLFADASPLSPSSSHSTSSGNPAGPGMPGMQPGGRMDSLQQGSQNAAVVSDPQLSHLQRFLDEVARQKQAEQEAKQPNPVLLRLLNQPQGNREQSLSGNLTSQTTPVEPTKTDVAAVIDGQPPVADVPEPKAAPQPKLSKPEPPTPKPKTQRPKKPEPVYYVVRVYLSEDQLIVGPFEAIDIQGWPKEHVAEAAMMGVSETMKTVWADVRKDALPAVRFLVSPGLESTCELTAAELKANDIPTRAIQREGRDYSVQQFFSDQLPPTTQQQSGGSASAGDVDEPQMQNGSSRQRRRSI